MPKVLFHIVFLMLSLFLVSAPSYAQPSADAILQKMASANTSHNYQGLFTYEQGGTLKTVKVFHGVDSEGKVTERLISQSGPPFEIIRNNSGCSAGVSGTVNFGQRNAETFSSKHVRKYYDVQIQGRARIANRQAVMVHFVPMDNQRFGYILGVDKETGLLLQSILVNQERRILERFQFVDIAIGMDSKQLQLAPMTAVKHKRLPSNACDQSNLSPVDWKAAWLPPGFMLIKSGNTAAGGSNTKQVLIFSDGLAAFSVFVEPVGQSKMPAIEAERGATMAFMLQKPYGGTEFLICVVGEVPLSTAKKVAISLAHSSSTTE